MIQVQVVQGLPQIKLLVLAVATTLTGMAPSVIAAEDATLPEVQVQAGRAQPGDLPKAYAGGQVAEGGRIGILGNQDIMDVPFSVTSYTSELIENQQAQTLGEVLANDPAVRSGYGFGNYAETFVIRGFTLDGDDIGFNGLYGLTPRQLVATENLERVEVFKGANAFLNGVSPQGSGIGGTINIVPKRAGDQPLTRATLSYGADNQVGGHIDIGRRFGAADQFGLRFNAVQREGETAIDDETRRLSSAALGWDFSGEALRLSADLIYQKQTARHARAVAFFTQADGEAPRAPSADTNFAQPWEYTELEDTVAMFRAEYDLSQQFTAYAAVGAKKTNESGDYASPRVNSSGVGTASRLGVNFEQDSLSGETGLRANFVTGPVRHRLNLGVTALDSENHSAFDFSGPYVTSIYDTPTVARPDALGGSGHMNDPLVTARTRNFSTALSDTLSILDDRVLFTLGLRRQNIDQTSYDAATGAVTANYDEWATSPVFGLVVKPTPYLSLYANRIQGLSQGQTAPQLTPGGVPVANAGQALAPFESEQTEVGGKLDFGNFGAAIALYEIERPNGLLAGNVFTNDGEQRNRGLELSAYGEPVDGWRVLGGASFTDAEMVKTQGGTLDGNTAMGVPKNQYNLGMEYDVAPLPGLTLTGRWIRTGSQYVNATNTLSIPRWQRFDVGARYVTTLNRHGLILRANLENLLDEDYWAAVSPTFGQVTLGAPRTLRLSASLEF